MKQSIEYGYCDRCDKKTSLDTYESDTNYHGYLCGKCRGYKDDKDFIKSQEDYDKELYKEWKKEQNKKRVK
jgi:hypothetical protein